MSIYFNGVCSDDLHLIVEERPPIVIARRKVEKTPIPGASRDLIEEQDAWENVTVPYKVALDRLKDTPDLIAYERKMSEWLMTPGGYQKLQDIFKPGYFRLANYVGGLDVQDLMGEAGRCTLTFDCDGRRFLDSGDEWQAVELAESGIALTNPTPYKAKPLISVTGTGKIAVAVNHWVNNRIVHHTTYVLNIGNSRQTVLIDSEKCGDATYANGNNANGILSIDSTGDSYARLYTTGVNVAAPFFGSEAYPGTVTAMSIKPRWYTV